MVFRMQRFQAFAGDVGVDLGGGDVGVAEQKLHHAQVSAVVDQVWQTHGAGYAATSARRRGRRFARAA